jgi:hypothetical protein
VSDLRKAAEMALDALEWISRVNAMDYEYQRKAQKPIQALRQALATEEALDRMVAENQRLGLYDDAMDWEAVAADQAMTIAMMKIENKKEWVGLTDADIAQTMHGSVEGSNVLPYQFARAIEAKLKGKNVPQP